MKIKPMKKAGRVSVELSRGDEPMLERSVTAAVRTPFAIKKILVPVDFSACSKKALDYAIPFAKQFGASLTLLYVVPANFPVGEFGMIDVAFMEKELREGGEKQLAELTATQIGREVRSSSSVRVGRPVTEIADVARKENIDLIIISTHGHAGLKHVLLGSVTENVVRYAPCPVLVVREHEHEFVKDLTE
jgi:nucleotide-binding universal stress UspA family protein